MLQEPDRSAKLRGLTPIMIDWPDLGQGRNGRFAAVCFRGRGLPLLSWVSTPEELGPRPSEPWYLVTSLTNPRQAVRMYRKRMQPEQYFPE